MKDFVKRLTEEEGEYFDSWLQGIRVLSKHQDSRNEAMDRLEELKNETS